MTATLPAGVLPDAAAVAARAGVVVRPLDSAVAVRDASALLARVWRTGPAASPLAPEVLRAVAHAGGYAVGAYRGQELVGVSAGFLGLPEGGPLLHSHIAGATEQGRGVGLALKLHQREWARARGVARISWTFDPLVRRNAWFNLGKLGAVGTAYLPDFYGAMTDGVNAGEASDRLYALWLLDAPTPGARSAEGAVLVLDADGDRPRAADALPDAGPVLVRLPTDVEALRTSDPAAAAAWRTAVRDVLVPALATGRAVSGMTVDGALLLS